MVKFSGLNFSCCFELLLGIAGFAGCFGPKSEDNFMDLFTNEPMTSSKAGFSRYNVNEIVKNVNN